MTRKSRIIGIGLLLFLTISVIGFPVQAAQEAEWKVKVGDTKNYEVKKYYDGYLLDFDGDPDLENVSIGGGEWYIYETGTKVKVEVIALNDVTEVAEVNETYAAEGVTAKNTAGTNPQGMQWVEKTINNKTYWEEILPDPTPIVNVTIEGDNIRTTGKMPWLFDATITWEYTFDRNWKTGWIEYMYQKLYNTSGTLTEVEYTSVSAGAPGFEIPVVIFGIFVTTFVFTRKRR